MVFKEKTISEVYYNRRKEIELINSEKDNFYSEIFIKKIKDFEKVEISPYNIQKLLFKSEFTSI